MNPTKNCSRRNFLRGAAGGLVLGFILPERTKLAAQAPPANIFAPPPAGKPMAYIRIGTDESVTCLIPKAEMGQGTGTACSQLLAEELECDWSRVRMEHAPVDPSLYGHQTTVGSMAIRTSWVPLRMAGAQAREMLIAAAALRWGVNASQCRAENGVVINTANSSRLSYGSLAAAAAKLPVPANATLKDPKQFRIVGKPMKRLDTRDKVTGRTKYGLDTRLPGMVYAVVERCPVFGGKVASFDATKAKAVPGVKDVIRISTGVAVVADSTWAAMQGRKALQVQWDEGAGASTSTASISKMLADRAKEPGIPARKEGDAQAGLAKAAKKIDAVYEVPFLSHAPMEPMNCTAHVQADGADMWVPTQSPTSSRALAAQTLGLPPEKINFHWTLMGGGFGRRGEGELDFVPEAAELGKALMGTPVKITWTREDDMRHDFYRPVSRVEFTGGLDAAGWPVALNARIACPSFFGGGPGGVDQVAVTGLSDLQYDIPDFLVDWRVANTIVPVSFLRGPGAIQNTFFAECFLDELCALGGKDPVEVRRRLLAKSPRLLAVLELAAAKAGWGKPLPPGRFQGVALGNNVGAFNAQIAEISITKGKVRIHRVVCAFDCGQVINPLTLTQQIEGGIVFGLAAALKGEITLDRGRVQQGNFNNYDVLRIDEMPVIETYIMPSVGNPSGAGEATVPPIAPAVVNAIFAATGKRIRKLPIRAAELI
jgi:isoquinoline 1-oxidoreductase beta subunit